MLFLEDFLEMLEDLPLELTERCTEIRRIDCEVQATLRRAELEIRRVFDANMLSAGEREDRLYSLQREYARIRELSQWKVNKAEAMQQLVEKYLVQLERERHNFQLELEADSPSITQTIEKRFTSYLEVVLAARRERRHKAAAARHAQNGGQTTALKGLARSELDSTDTSATSVQRRGRKRGSVLAANSKVGSPSSEHENGDSQHGSDQPASKRSFDLAATTASAFVSTESRHGRPRKLTSRVTEMFLHGGSRRGSHHASSSAHHAASGSGADEEEDEDGDGGGGGGGEDGGGGGGGGGEDEEDEGARRTWCVCNQPSYGAMLACDGANCPYEWFHLECVGIKTAPSGNWYCAHCTAEAQ